MGLSKGWLGENLHVIAALIHELEVGLLIAFRRLDAHNTMAVQLSEDAATDGPCVIVCVAINNHRLLPFLFYLNSRFLRKVSVRPLKTMSSAPRLFKLRLRPLRDRNPTRP